MTIDAFHGLSRCAAAPLPAPGLAVSAGQRLAGDQRQLTTGCYLLNYTPAANSSFVTYDGTLRIEASSGSPASSGDLYARAFDPFADAFASPPDPAAGIPIFPIKSYRYYLRVTQILAGEAGFSITFEALRFSEQQVPLLDGSSTQWPREGAFVAQIAPAPAPPGYPSPEQYFEGDVVDEVGASVGRLSMGRVSPHLRKATVEFDRVAASELALDNGAGVTWRTIYDKVGWDLNVVISDGDVEEPPDGTWNEAEAHAALARRDSSNLDTEWRYHMLAVRLIDVPNGARGVMYDRSGTVPREGAVVSSHYVFPFDEPHWGLVKGTRTATTATYFRTAVHELGHAMGLEHLDRGFHIMRPTVDIALESGPIPFPGNIQWSHSPDDEHRLRHWPDLVVRPGALSFGAGSSAASAAVVSDRHRLEVAPLLASVPLGAPVRVDVRLVNVSDRPALGPQTLSLSSGHVRGQVIDSSAAVRTFGPLAVYENAHPAQSLEPGAQVDASLTLLSGRQGMLFPTPGAYRVEVVVGWIFDGIPRCRVGSTTVVVTAAVDAAHTEAARRVLTTPDTLLTLVFGGDHVIDGIEAIGVALKNDILRPHFAWIEAKRLAGAFGKRAPDLRAAAELIDRTTVMSPGESRKAVR